MNIAKLLKPGDRTINFSKVRLVGENGEQMGLIAYSEAQEKARSAGLDLVLVAEHSDPPVCRIMDYGKLLFEQKKNFKNQRKRSLTQKVKEVKFHVNVDKHDYDYKIEHARAFLGKGNKVKITLALRGREMAHKEMAFDLVNKITEDLKGFGNPEVAPKFQGRNMTVPFAPDKKGKH
ncbi:MAG: translation initiation factor IF-3 [Victivallaceae bacterium]|nr:translation initiation factor IF-3 [Victivallaceae bacterium]